MKSFSILTLLLTTLILSACGAKATPPPTLSVVDLQSTAGAVAFTMIAQTQAAIPTATPPPATETFTNTLAPITAFVPSPLPEATFTPVPNVNLVDSNPAGGGDCIHQALPGALEGRKVKIRVNNSTKAAINLSVYLNQITPQTVCGYRIYTIGAQQSIVITDLVEGCFTLWAWNPDPKGYFMVTNGAASCIISSDTPVFDISTHGIRSR